MFDKIHWKKLPWQKILVSLGWGTFWTFIGGFILSVFSLFLSLIWMAFKEEPYIVSGIFLTVGIVSTIIYLKYDTIYGTSEKENN